MPYRSDVPYGSWPPSPPRRTSRLAIILAAAAVTVVVVALLGVLALLASGIPGLTGGTTLGAVEVGQCFNGARIPAGTTMTVFNVDLVDCSEPHESELFAKFEYASAESGSTFPGDTVLAEYADEECLEQFAAYVGVTYYASTLDMSYLRPTSASWRFGDRSIQCVVNPPLGEERMTGSVRDSRR